jgi:predicted ATP-binding protein involved in virulence
MFNSINTNESNVIDSIIFGDNGKGKVKVLDKIAMSNDLNISNVLLVELELQPIVGSSIV